MERERRRRRERGGGRGGGWRRRRSLQQRVPAHRQACVAGLLHQFREPPRVRDLSEDDHQGQEFLNPRVGADQMTGLDTGTDTRMDRGSAAFRLRDQGDGVHQAASSCWRSRIRWFDAAFIRLRRSCARSSSVMFP